MHKSAFLGTQTQEYYLFNNNCYFIDAEYIKLYLCNVHLGCNISCLLLVCISHIICYSQSTSSHITLNEFIQLIQLITSTIPLIVTRFKLLFTSFHHTPTIISLITTHYNYSSAHSTHANYHSTAFHLFSCIQ